MTALATFSRYWHTVRHLRPVQIYGRAWFRIARPAPRLHSAPGLRPQTGTWQLPARREPSLTGPGEFLFIGERGSLGSVGWDGPQREKLWRYNQHYFDDLNALAAEERTSWHLALLQHWVRSNPPGSGNGWEPYPTSLRIVNWIKWALAGNELPAECLHSLAVQTRWLAGRLERHLLGNHLFANAKALIFAGVFHAGPEAAAWLSRGLAIVRREIPEQVLADGGHFERSTMYHALAFEDVLDLCNLAAAYSTAQAIPAGDLRVWREAALRMRKWLALMSHPDGRISFFNDAAFGIAPEVAELDDYADRLVPGAEATSGSAQRGPLAGWHLADSGYVRLDGGRGTLLADVGPVGPDYLPGHAHADTLSFEFSLGLQRVLVNSGTSVYGNGPERLRQRGTAAHNTVVIQGSDSSEVWSGFRVARRARPFGFTMEERGGPDAAITVRCSHDGYRRLPAGPVHERTWTFGTRHLTIEDAITADAVNAEARFHLHPTVRAKLDPGARGGTLLLEDGTLLRWSAGQGEPRIESTTWHPRFGVGEPNECIVLPLRAGRCRMRIDWEDT